MFTSKCCCCSLQTGSIVVGVFTMIVSLVALGLEIYVSWNLNRPYCVTRRSYSGGRLHTYVYEEICTQASQLDRMMSAIIAFLASWNFLEVMTSAGLIWGASKRSNGWLTAWLMTSVCWIALHSALLISHICTDNEGALIILQSVLGIFFWAMSLLSVLTVGSLHNEISGLSQVSRIHIVPPPPPVQHDSLPRPLMVYSNAGHQPNWHGQPQLHQQQQQLLLQQHWMYGYNTASREAIMKGSYPQL